ncbi:MAG: hypothetical protein ACLQD9_06260 [Thermoplasmata archaeon]
MVGVPLVLAGTLVVCAITVFLGAVEEDAIAGVIVPVPNWTPTLVWLVPGVGLLLWAVGWFIQRIPEADSESPPSIPSFMPPSG